MAGPGGAGGPLERSFGRMVAKRRSQEVGESFGLFRVTQRQSRGASLAVPVAQGLALVFGEVQNHLEDHSQQAACPGDFWFSGSIRSSVRLRWLQIESLLLWELEPCRSRSPHQSLSAFGWSGALR
jgi:hypothetical protein